MRAFAGRQNRARRQGTVIEPPTPDQGARRVWADSKGRIWVSEWHVGQVGVYDPSNGHWREWKLPGASPRAYAVYGDDKDMVWLSDFGANAMVRFDPRSEQFNVFELESKGAQVRQILVRRVAAMRAPLLDNRGDYRAAAYRRTAPGARRDRCRAVRRQRQAFSQGATAAGVS